MKTIEELKEMMKLSGNFRNKVWSDCYDQAMEDQRYVFDDLNGLPGVRVYDHYTSFYCRIADRRKFLEGMAEQCFDSEWQKIAESLLKKENVLQYDMTYDNKQWDNLDEWLDTKAEELLADVEKFLHSYEDISDDYVDDYLELAIENGWYDNATIKDGKVMIYHPAYWETL